MEQILTNRSRIPARITFLKPVSAAVAIGTGGPFGAEGPIIATGGALGSLVGQFFASRRRNEKRCWPPARRPACRRFSALRWRPCCWRLNYCCSSFGPARSFPWPCQRRQPLACGRFPNRRRCFRCPMWRTPSVWRMAFYILLGAVMGVAAAMVIAIVYFTEDTFEQLPIHWMWWPAIGGIAVGVCRLLVPRTLGVGYENISDIFRIKATGR